MSRTPPARSCTPHAPSTALDLVPVPGLWARKEIAAVPAKGEVFRVRLRPFAVPDEVVPVAESGVGAYDALQHADDPACSLFWRGYEEALVPLVEVLRYPETALLRSLPLPIRDGVDNVQLPRPVAYAVKSDTLITPLDPGQLSLRTSSHQCPLDTWSR